MEAKFSIAHLSFFHIEGSKHHAAGLEPDAQVVHNSTRDACWNKWIGYDRKGG